MLGSDAFVVSSVLFCGRVLSGMLPCELFELGDVVEDQDNAGSDNEMMTTMEIDVDFQFVIITMGR